MSNWNGKGSKSRVQNLKDYTNNFDNIDFSKYREIEDDHDNNAPHDFGKCLLLDDIRDSRDCYLYGERMTLKQASGIPHDIWVVVRNYDEFVKYLEENGIPDVVSFDNDLDPYLEIVQERNMCASGFYDFRSLPNKTGCHCAEYLAKKCIRENHEVPEYYIHTMNSLARPIIAKIMEDAIDIMVSGIYNKH